MDAKELRRLLSYDAETGRLTWMERSVELFPSQHAANVWNSRYAGKRAFKNVSVRGYYKGLVFGHTYAAHRVVWALVHGDWPAAGLDIDHINGVKTDNRIANLRLASRAENSRNRSPQKGRRYRGITLRGDRWVARCKDVDGRYHESRGWKSDREAAAAFNAMAVKYHGEFARPNDMREA